MDDLFPGLASARQPSLQPARPSLAGWNAAGHAFGLMFGGAPSGDKPRAPVDQPLVLPAVTRPEPGTATIAAPRGVTPALAQRAIRTDAATWGMGLAEIPHAIPHARHTLSAGDPSAATVPPPQDETPAPSAFPLTQDATRPQVLPGPVVPDPVLTGPVLTGPLPTGPLDAAGPVITDAPIGARYPSIQDPAENAITGTLEINLTGDADAPDGPPLWEASLLTALPGALPPLAGSDVGTPAPPDPFISISGPVRPGEQHADGFRSLGGPIKPLGDAPDQPLVLPASRDLPTFDGAVRSLFSEPHLPITSGAGAFPPPLASSIAPSTDPRAIVPARVAGTGSALSPDAIPGPRSSAIPLTLPLAATAPAPGEGLPTPSGRPGSAPPPPAAAAAATANIGPVAESDPVPFNATLTRAPDQSMRPVPPPGPAPGATGNPSTARPDFTAPELVRPEIIRPVPRPALEEDAPRNTFQPDRPLRTGSWIIPSAGQPQTATTTSFDPSVVASVAPLGADPVAGTLPTTDSGLATGALVQSGTSPGTAPGTAPGGLPQAHTPATLANAAAQQIAAALSDPARDPGAPLELALDPPELGRVRLQITELAGIMTLTIHAERPETVELMRRHLDLLAQEFMQSGLDAPSVRISRDGAGQGGGQSHARDDDPAHATPEPGGPNPIHHRTPEGALDLRL